jgi:hypothetical protein
MSTQTFYSYPLNPGDIWDLNGGDTYIIQNFTSGDFTGTSGNNVLIRCVNGIAYLQLPSSINVSFFELYGVSANQIISADSSCIDWGNNYGIVSASPATFPVTLTITWNGNSYNQTKTVIYPLSPIPIF